MKQVTITLFNFPELSEQAQKRAIEEYRDVMAGEDTQSACDIVVEDLTGALKLMGFDDIAIEYSVSYSQGDYANFSAGYNSGDADLDKLEKEYPSIYKEFFVDAGSSLSTRYNGNAGKRVDIYSECDLLEDTTVVATFKPSNRSYGHGCHYLDIEDPNGCYDRDELYLDEPEPSDFLHGSDYDKAWEEWDAKQKNAEEVYEMCENYLDELQSDIGRLIYRQLAAAIEATLEDDYIEEILINNDYYFTEDGSFSNL